MLTCSKTYRDIPLGHRQPFHPGRCSLIHGHNWAIRITFTADRVDPNGFVVDFGELHYLKDWIDQNLDHACVFSATDPLRSRIEEMAAAGLLKPLFIDNASCEGLARHLYETFNPMVTADTEGRAHILSIDLEEDSRNSATYTS
jgi:6-pyruvoyltetrahydropterin/6-carboxytetrahydropterin synthase